MTSTRITEEQKAKIRHSVLASLDFAKNHDCNNFNLVAETMDEILAILQPAPEVERVVGDMYVYECPDSGKLGWWPPGFYGKIIHKVKLEYNPATNTARIVSGGEV